VQPTAVAPSAWASGEGTRTMWPLNSERREITPGYGVGMMFSSDMPGRSGVVIGASTAAGTAVGPAACPHRGAEAFFGAARRAVFFFAAARRVDFREAERARVAFRRVVF